MLTKLSSSPPMTQPVRDEVEIWTQKIWFYSPKHYLPCDSYILPLRQLAHSLPVATKHWALRWIQIIIRSDFRNGTACLYWTPYALVFFQEQIITWHHIFVCVFSLPLHQHICCRRGESSCLVPSYMSSA